MRAAILTVLSFTLVLPLRASALDDLRRALTELRGAAPVTVKIDSVDRRSDGKKQEESRGTAVAEDDGTRIRMVHDKSELRRRMQSDDHTDSTISPSEACELLNYAPSLLDALQGATLRRVAPSSFDGTPATLLEVTPLRKKDEDGDKWIKDYADTLLLWLGPGGVPLAAERTFKIKGRIVVIGFEMSKKETFRFLRAGDRLLVTRRTTESAGSGLGHSENGVRTATVALVR